MKPNRKKTKKILVVAMAFSFFVSLMISCSPPGPPERLAFVYGVSIYDTGEAEGVYPNLTYADDDAEAISPLLEANGWTVSLRTDTDVTRAAIEADIAAVPDGFEGQVLVYYSGHGFAGDFGDGLNQYICPYGSIVLVPAYALVRDAMMSPQDIRTAVESHSLKNVVLIIDSCFSGGFVDPGVTIDPIPQKFGPLEEGGGSILFEHTGESVVPAIMRFAIGQASPSMIVLSAAGAGESSWERDGHGVFTSFVLDAPGDTDSNGHADADFDRDGLITTDELYAFAVAGITQKWNALYGAMWTGTEYRDFYPHASGTLRAAAILAANP